ncbi:MAG: cobalt-precorrin-5B (C(1))-methyltransferase [Pseudomonadota bacterium]
MVRPDDAKLRTGFTTGACATAAAAAAAGRLVTGAWSDPVTIFLPRGQRVAFPLISQSTGENWAEAAIEKDAGDDPDVTHGVHVTVRLVRGAKGSGLSFQAGPGVGRVTKPGLPIPPGDPAINPVPRRMIQEAVSLVTGGDLDFDVLISVPGGAEIARRTWNPRLGIEGGISILGTTGIVRPFSCAAWIASIHRGIDVARATGTRHAVGSTGATSEAAAQAHFGLPDHAMLDMGDFAGGMLKYLRAHPLERITVAGGFAKLTKLAQGALDLHSSRSTVDFDDLASMAVTLGLDRDRIAACNTAMEALELGGPVLARLVASRAGQTAKAVLHNPQTELDVMVVDRAGAILAIESAP